MMFWEKILKNALLGTERMTPNDEIVPDDLRVYLTKVDQADQELYLLKVLTLASIYRKSGQLSVPPENDTFEAAPAETRPYCPPHVMKVWQKVLKLHLQHPYLLELFLLKLRQRQWLIAPDAIVKLLAIGNSRKGLLLIDLIGDAVGERGMWLLRFNPSWSGMTETDNERIFMTGKPAERIAALKRMRRVDPSKGRELLMASWDKETSKNRPELLKSLAINFSEADRGFVDKHIQIIDLNPAEPLLYIFLSSEQIEKRFMSLRVIPEKYVWGDLPFQFSWSPAFSEYMLKQLYASYVNYHFEKAKMFVPLIAYLHPAFNPARIPASDDMSSKIGSWELFWKDLNPVLECRREIETM